MIFNNSCLFLSEGKQDIHKFMPIAGYFAICTILHI
jgi:hypothetical protein